MKLKLALPVLAASLFAVGCQSSGVYSLTGDTQSTTATAAAEAPQDYFQTQEYRDTQDLFDHGYVTDRDLY
ncbi:hypothetical protein [Algisphaera agarilytica]|uniref:Uncharacterized protein n=1 Tax=Algisphaera agarilytica TaxID=1385975 RepID=A0A7X0LJG3_9BACT|nr:hypothetical protein [Algisphaera agarilytica]MBB6428729.1 hypothetical protein [Algisphaera agarilytica]